MSLSSIDLRAPYKHKYGKEFGPESRVINEMYHSHLKDYQTPGIHSVTIKVYDNWGSEMNEGEVKGYKTIYIQFDFINYFKLDKFNRKKMQLDAIQKGMIIIAQAEGWAIDPLLDAYNSCLAKNLDYQFRVGKPKASKNRKHKIGFWCNWDIDIFEVFWVLYDSKGGEIKRQRFIHKPSYEGRFIFFVQWKWIDNSTVLFEDRYKYSRKEKWTIDLELS